MTCVVISCSSIKQRLSLSFNVSMQCGPDMPSDHALMIVDIVGKADSGLDVQIKPSNTPAFLPRMHLSDHVTHCGPLLQIFSPSLENTEVKSLSNVLYYGRNHDKTYVSLLLKFYIFIMLILLYYSKFCVNLFIEYVKSRKKKFIKNAVWNIYRIFTKCLWFGSKFSKYFKSLLHIVMYKYLPACNINFYFQMLSDKFIADSSQHFQIGQSVHAKVSTLCLLKKQKKQCLFTVLFSIFLRAPFFFLFFLLLDYRDIVLKIVF